MSSNGFLNSIPPVTRNLLFINIILFMVQQLVAQRGGDVLADLFGLHFFLAPDFRLWQVVTYMFLHGSWSHVLLNMFSLWMFGRIIEQTMGQRRFLIYYFICGVGAALCQELWQLGQYYIEGLNRYTMVSDGVNTISMSTYLNSWVTIGASGACYGVLLAFGMTFPEERIMLLFPPIPMKAKYFVVGYALIEVFSAFYSNGNIRHFAHLGGMFFGWLYFPATGRRKNHGRAQKQRDTTIPYRATVYRRFFVGRRWRDAAHSPQLQQAGAAIEGAIRSLFSGKAKNNTSSSLPPRPVRTRPRKRIRSTTSVDAKNRSASMKSSIKCAVPATLLSPKRRKKICSTTRAVPETYVLLASSFPLLSNP